MKRVTGLLCLLLITLGCTKNISSTKQSSDEKEFLKYPLYIDLENIHTTDSVEALLSVDASECVYIPLETNGNALIRRIEKVLFWGDHILVSEFQNLCLFDRSGKFIQKISQQGEGPEDYNRVNNIITDPVTGMLYIFSRNKVIKFDKNTKYVDNYIVKSEEYLSGGIMTPDEIFLLSVPNQVKLLKDTAKVFSLIATDSLGNVMKYYENTTVRRAESVKMALTGISNLYAYDKNVRFKEFGNDTLFTILKDSMMPYAILYLGEMKMNHNPDASQAQSFEEVQKIYDGLSDKLFVVHVLENNTYVYILLNWGVSEKELSCVYNKENGKLTHLKDNGLQNDLDGGISFFPRNITENGDMIAWKSAEEFKEEILSKDYDMQKAKYGERFEKVYQLAKSLKEDDNPVLIITKK